MILPGIRDFDFLVVNDKVKCLVLELDTHAKFRVRVFVVARRCSEPLVHVVILTFGACARLHVFRVGLVRHDYVRRRRL